MQVIEVLRRSTLPPESGEEVSEFRLLCSGTLYRGKVQTYDWRKSDVCRVLLDGRIVLFVASQPVDFYPQELMLRIPVCMAVESNPPVEGKAGFSKIGFPHREVAADLCALLTLLLRRLVCLHTQVRVMRRPGEPSGFGMDDWPLPVTQTGRPAVWRRRPLGITTDVDGRRELDDPSPAAVPVDSTWLKCILSELPAMPAAKTVVSCARLYAQGMELIEERPDVAYQLFIAAAETLAQAALKDYSPTDEERVATKKAVLEKAASLGLSASDARELALTATQGLTWAAKKFEGCLLRYTDHRIWEKDDLFIQLEPALPKEENFADALRLIYRSRSAALHSGEALGATAGLGTSPYIPVEAMAAMFSGKRWLPPVTWFERVVQRALCLFIESQRQSS